MGSKLIVVPGNCFSLGGTLVTLSSLLKGFEEVGASEKIVVLVLLDSKMDHYLTHNGLGKYLVKLDEINQKAFLKAAINWANQQPIDWPLLLDNTISRKLILTLILSSFKLRFSSRKIYHFFHDLALSHNMFGFWMRKLTFLCLNPTAIANSNFTARHINKLILGRCHNVLYQPVDFQRFNASSSCDVPPKLQSLLSTGRPLILTPSRITKPHMVNDKNLRAIVHTLVYLKRRSYDAHCVVIGEDASEGQVYSNQLLALAKNLEVSDSLTILPPAYEIEDYYKHADLVLTMAPREPFGRTVIEAISCGVPVVGSNTGGIGEILGHFAPEWSVAPNDYQQVADTVIEVLESERTSDILLKARDWLNDVCSASQYAINLRKITNI